MKKTKDSQETKILRKPVARIETTADTGLTQAQVKERMEKGWSNAPVDSPSKTTKEIIISNVFTVGWNKDFFFRQGFPQCNSVFMIIRIGEGSVRCHAGKR